ncbi:MAG TPA: prenyltransferase/squalene oxidase repeat-containing protein [Gemmataceae bacterium]|jgi:N-acyl-D-amino-acid deacylase|nr:prenyltransferase/squalene oxidase repeat-containing protein [Gemmataceae bacterium]
MISAPCGFAGGRPEKPLAAEVLKMGVRLHTLVVTAGWVLFLAHTSFADEPPKPPGDKQDEIAKSVSRGLAIVQKAATNYPKHRECFSCHHQTLPMLAMVTTREHGVKIDDELLQAQAKFTHKSFENSIAELKKGKGVGGRAMTVGYAAWALLLADTKPDHTTEALVEYLLKTQREEGHWTGQVCRPPLEESYFTATLLAVQTMKHYGTEAQGPHISNAIFRAKSWVASAPAKSQEDKAMRLWALHMLDGRKENVLAARIAVLKEQRPDGGWAQLDEMESDAYATGQTLFALQAAGLPANEPAYRRGIDFLLKTQKPDGSWFVRSRSKPIQADFDNGDPHGKDQFISIPATAWATAALAAAIPGPVKSGPQPGQRIPTLFLPISVYYAANPEKNGEPVNLVCHYGGNPTVMIFARSVDSHLTKLVLRLDEAAERHQNARFGVSVVLLSGEETETAAKRLRALRENGKLKRVSLSYMPKGPPEFNLAGDAEWTVLLYKKYQVQSNLAWRKGEIDDEAVDKVLAGIGAIVSSK